MTSSLSSVLAHIDAQLDSSVARLCELLRIPSISTDPAHAQDCGHAADWLARELKEIGFEVAVHPTPGHPIVVAHDNVSSKGPHVLFYGHYDVQPVDPLPLWRTPPFEPALVTTAGGERQIVARGASDDKGQLMTFIEACRAWKEVVGSLPIKVSLLLEGEEETGNPNLLAFLQEHRAELSHDLALVCDTDLWDDKTPAVTTMLRGLVSEEFEIICADRDLHSGMYGNAVRNPLHIVARIIADLCNEAGRITLSGFYDAVPELAPAVHAEWSRLPFDETHFLGQFGLRIPAGEQGCSILEQVWARPSFEVHGIKGGYTGEGFKTVLPSRASAKVSFRLVGQQDPEQIRMSFRAFVQDRVPADCAVTFTNHGSSKPVSAPLDGVWLQRARVALTEEWHRDTAVSGTGGSIPAISHFKTILDMDSLLIGFARFDNRIHSPNEKYDLSSLYHGIRSWARILDGFSR
jgi:acetylornithine deacetylase/succinyl-diaminopimelate desuccinylase-like protein